MKILNFIYLAVGIIAGIICACSAIICITLLCKIINALIDDKAFLSHGIILLKFIATTGISFAVADACADNYC